MNNATEIALQNRLGELHAARASDHLRGLHDAMVATTRYNAPPEEDAHNWLWGTLDIDHADGTTSHGIAVWTRRAEQGAWERARFPTAFSQRANDQPLSRLDGEETMNNEAGNAADYDDEPRSNGNFGMDVQQQQDQGKNST